MRRKRILNAVDKKRSFYIMNRDAKYFKGLLRGDVEWTNDQNDAKKFDEVSKTKVLKRWKPEENIEIVFIE